MRIRHLGLPALTPLLAIAGWEAARGFDCAPIKCPEIKTCAEARHKLETCGHSERDADSDGIPCEALCGDTIEIYTARSGKGTAPPAAQNPVDFIAPPAVADDALDFACDGKRTCREMASCEEAKFYLDQCGVTSLDRDGDGRPCNSLCR
ncbi:MAG: excalibur calcium-binding domain-containing protein [Hyphomicrobium sp.]|nr:excalibur calcium-binding domain-containing protein [Hyphomicrobium sp.]